MRRKKGFCACGAPILFVFHRKLHYSVLYLGLLLYGFGRLAIFQVCYNYLVEIAGFRKKIFSVGPFDFTYNSLFGTSFAIPFVLGSMIGGSAYFHYQHHSPNLFYIAYSSFFVIPLLALPFLSESHYIRIARFSKIFFPLEKIFWGQDRTPSNDT